MPTLLIGQQCCLQSFVEESATIHKHFAWAIIQEIKPFLKQKLQKFLKTYTNMHFGKLTLTLHNGNIFANTTKNSGVSGAKTFENFGGFNIYRILLT